MALLCVLQSYPNTKLASRPAKRFVFKNLRKGTRLAGKGSQFLKTHFGLGTNAKSLHTKNTVFEAGKGLEANCSRPFLPYILIKPIFIGFIYLLIIHLLFI